MLRIRLQRIGRRDQPYFRVVVAESTIKQEGRVVENLGLYDPAKDGKERLVVKTDRVKYWRSKGAQMSDGAMKLLLSTAEKKKIWPDKKPAKPEGEESAEKAAETEPKAEPKAEEKQPEAEAAPAEEPAKETESAQQDAE